MRFPQEGRDHRQDQQQDQPGIKNHQTGSQEDNADHILKLGQYLRHQHRSPGSLPSGSFQFIVKFGILKLVKVQFGGMADQVHRSTVGHQISQQAVQQRDGPVDQGAHHGQAEFQADHQPEVLLVDHLPILQRNNAVDDLLANIEHSQRDGGVDDPQDDISQCHTFTGLPDQFKKRRQVF